MRVAIAALCALCIVKSVLAENTPCRASYCVEPGDELPVPSDAELPMNATMLAPLQGEAYGRGLFSRYPIFGKAYLYALISHDVAAFLGIIIMLYQFLLSKRGSYLHKLLGRVFVCESGSERQIPL